MERNQNIHDLKKKSQDAGLAPSDLLEAAENLCSLRGVPAGSPTDLSNAIDEIVRFRQVERAINSTLL